MAAKCIVWEWQENSMLWLPYSAQLSQFLEDNFAKNLHDKHLNLGAVEPSMACYDINFGLMIQTRKDTGTVRGVRRTVCAHDSPFARGFSWTWEGDYGDWISYDVTTACDLEKACDLQHSMLDLSSCAIGLPNIVDFRKMEQINKNTGFRRKVLRKSDPHPYPKDTKRSPSKSMPKSPGGHSASKAPASNVSPSKQESPKSESDKKSKAKKLKVSKSGVLQKFCKTSSNPPDEECAICIEKLSKVSGFCQTASSTLPKVKQLTKCNHCFHEECLLELLKNSKGGCIQCPTCKTIHGHKIGTQPDGSMTVHSTSHSLPGYPDCGMITIRYDFRPGIQGPEHPHPGNRYHTSGFPRTCYLPDNQKGQKVLRLLREAWSRRLIFTIATSVTTGLEDTVVWNEIHHKTDAFTNHSGHGYPDPKYLDNVLAELASQGVEDDGT
ncbi:E3 ubiquitin-protein ligase DTX4 isoform X2 [Nematostella vectensis]|uniref:E3 ubiquitin-protein ligase DTX4 isoform X2 n=1 Tax=Nematostella vectensis TaxID=45351 RepID=UPI002076DDAB|nr:E3 ubiquitin-protein ligase DTX4 isoform X2 [Nematostella vectensis]